jgi:hypothetical protein
VTSETFPFVFASSSGLEKLNLNMLETGDSSLNDVPKIKEQY